MQKRIVFTKPYSQLLGKKIKVSLTVASLKEAYTHKGTWGFQEVYVSGINVIGINEKGEFAEAVVHFEDQLPQYMILERDEVEKLVENGFYEDKSANALFLMEEAYDKLKERDAILWQIMSELETDKVPYEIAITYNGWQVGITLKNGSFISAALHDKSIKNEDFAIELMGALTYEEAESTNCSFRIDTQALVKDFESYFEVVKRMTWCFRNNSYIYKEDEKQWADFTRGAYEDAYNRLVDKLEEHYGASIYIRKMRRDDYAVEHSWFIFYITDGFTCHNRPVKNYNYVFEYDAPTKHVRLLDEEMPIELVCEVVGFFHKWGDYIG